MHRRVLLKMTAGVLAAGTIRPRMARAAGAAQATQRFVETPFGRISCLEQGRGDAALFLHGFPLTSYQWRGALERLSGIRRCIAPDFMGLGRSEIRDGQSVTPDAQVAMLVALLDALSIRSVDLVASDSGGAVAQLLAVRHSGRVRTMLLTNCDVETDSPPPALAPMVALAKSGQFVDEWLVPWLADKNLARSARGIGGMCYTDPLHPTDEAIERYFGPIVGSQRRKDQLHAYLVALEINPLAGIETALRASRIPARVVWGTADDIFSAAGPDYLGRVLGNSRGVRRLEGRKLFWPEELPDVVAEEARGLWL